MNVKLYNHNLVMVNINRNYLDYLNQFDNKVPQEYTNINAKKRPYIGIAFKINSLLYFIPLSSKKTKFFRLNNRIDFFKLDNGNLGAFNFNNMIPVKEKVILLFDVDNETDIKYKNLILKQLRYINRRANKIKRKAFRLYDKYINNKLDLNTKNRCCNFTLLEQKAKLYIPTLYVYQNKHNSKLELFTEENNSSDYNLVFTYNVSQNEIGKLPIDKYNDYINIINQIKHYYKDENSFTNKQLSKISDIGIEKATIELKEIAKSFNNQISIEQNNNIIKP